MKLKSIMLGATACALALSPVWAQSTPADPPSAHAAKKHHHRVSGLEDRLSHMERLIEEQQAEIRELRAKVGVASASGGASTAVAAAPEQPAPQPAVSAAEFQALQNQVFEQTAA